MIGAAGVVFEGVAGSLVNDDDGTIGRSSDGGSDDADEMDDDSGGDGNDSGEIGEHCGLGIEVIFVVPVL